MSGKSVTISGRASATIIATEVVLLLLITWIYAGMPGLRRYIGPATVTIQFGPLAPSQPPLARSHQI
jgi:hypothetical protein